MKTREIVSALPEDAVPIAGYGGRYWVARDGSVYALYRCDIIKLSPGVLRHGYHNVVLAAVGPRKNKLVHRLVAEAFVPRVEGKGFVNHINGIKSDNRAENLEWVSASENRRHALDVLNVRRANNRAGNWDGKVKLSVTEVLEIRARYEAGELRSHLARAFDVTHANVSAIVERKSWRHV